MKQCAQIEDVKQKIRNCKNARKTLLVTQKRLQQEVLATQEKRAVLSDEIKRLIGAIIEMSCHLKAERNDQRSRVLLSKA